MCLPSNCWCFGSRWGIADFTGIVWLFGPLRFTVKLSLSVPGLGTARAELAQLKEWFLWTAPIDSRSLIVLNLNSRLCGAYGRCDERYGLPPYFLCRAVEPWPMGPFPSLCVIYLCYYFWCPPEVLSVLAYPIFASTGNNFVHRVFYLGFCVLSETRRNCICWRNRVFICGFVACSPISIQS